MSRALYGRGGYYRAARGPGHDFRTSSTVAPALLARALLGLFAHVQDALGSRAADLVEIGAGGGHLLGALADLAPPQLRLCGVEVAPRPPGLPARVRWQASPPPEITGVVVAFEWLDVVPLDIVVDGRLLPAATGMVEGPPPSAADTSWLDRWWPGWTQGWAEVGSARDHAWAAAVRSLSAGLAVAVDYGHTREARPGLPTLTGYRRGRPVPPVPDGTRDLTAHVAMDSVAVPGLPTALLRQADALPASTAPPAPTAADGAAPKSLQALRDASLRARLLDPQALGSHLWLVQAVGMGMPSALIR